MTFISKLYQCHFITTNDNRITKEKLLIKSMSLLLFLGCFIFVSFRSYQCFCKFLLKPKSVDISFDFIGHVSFPSITFCPPMVNPLYPKPYNITVLKDCGLLFDIQTFEGNEWYGSSARAEIIFCIHF